MIRQLCPQCGKLVELPPTAAGGKAECPLCRAGIAVPAAYAPSVAADGGLSALPPPPTPTPVPGSPPVPNDPLEPAPPPGLHPAVLNPPPAPPPQPDAAPPPPPGAAGSVPVPPAPGGYTRSTSLTFSPGWLAWVPVACLTLVAIFTMFTWVGTYPGGIKVYSQNPWWALFGEMSTNTVPDELQQEETAIEKLLLGNRWLIGYLPLLLLTTFLLWLERFIRNPDANTLPGPIVWVANVWPKRFALLTILTGALTVFLVMQTIRGYGLESAIRQRVEERYAKDVSEATNTNQKQKVAVRIGEDFSKFHYQTTTVFQLAMTAQVLGFAGMLFRWWLHRRGNKPHPRLLFQW